MIKKRSGRSYWIACGLLASTTLGEQAWAENDCGAAVGGIITCTGAGNPYAQGIIYLNQASGTALRVTSDAHIDGVGQIYRDGVLLSGQVGPFSVDLAGPINAGGVAVSAASGAVTITGTAPILGHVLGATEGAPSTIIVGDVTVRADGVQGVTALAPQGPASLVAGPSDASITVNGTVVTTGGPVFINRYETDTATGVRAGGDGTSLATINGRVQTTGAGAYGVSVGQALGGLALVRGNGAVITTGTNSTGVWANSSGITSVQIGSVSTSGVNATAIDASIYEPYPYVETVRQVFVEAGTVSTSGANSIGIAADNPAGDARVTLNGTLQTSGDGSTGIHAMSGEGFQLSTPASTSVIAHGTVSTSGVNADAIVAAATNGASTVSVDSVLATGAGSRAIEITASTNGSVTVSGAVRSALADAIVASGDTVAITVLDGARVAGGDTAVALNSTSGSTVTNTGSITGGSGPAISGVGGAVTILNRGTLSGRVAFAGGGNSLENDGLFVATGNSDFGGSNSTFNNSGTLAVLPVVSTPGTVAFANLTHLASSGTVDLRNGHAGDVLSVSGSFAGMGASTLALDVNFAQGTSDRLVVAGTITGKTLVQVNALTSSASGPNSIVFASGGAGSSGQAFTLASSASDLGNTYRYGLAYSAGNNSYSLVVAPGEAVYRTLKFSEAATTLWQRSADGWSAHMTNLRDAETLNGPAPGRVWGSITGSTALRRDTYSFNSFGESRAVTLSYEQDSFGGQLGVDLSTAGRFRFGITGGYLDSQMNFRSSDDHVRFDAANIGAYAGAVAGVMFVNLLGKLDHYWADAGGTGAVYRGHFNGNAYGFKIEMGARLRRGALFAEPVLRLAYVRTDLSSLRPLGAVIDFDGFDGLRGQAGGRLGATIDSGHGAHVLLYGEGDYVREFKGQDGISFTGGTTLLAYRNDRVGNYGEAKLGLNVSSGHVTGFIEGFGEVGHDYRGGGGRAGVRVGL